MVSLPLTNEVLLMHWPGALLQKIKRDLWITHTKAEDDQHYFLDHAHADDLDIASPARNVRTRLYFTSESHLHTLLNVLRYPHEGITSIIPREGMEILEAIPELSYLTQVIIRLFEIETGSSDSPPMFRCEISFSAGATNDPILDKSSEISPYVTLNNHVSFEDMMRILESGIEMSRQNYCFDS